MKILKLKVIKNPRKKKVIAIKKAAISIIYKPLTGYILLIKFLSGY
jgi:hypothetical protein